MIFRDKAKKIWGLSFFTLFSFMCSNAHAQVADFNQSPVSDILPGIEASMKRGDLRELNNLIEKAKAGSNNSPQVQLVSGNALFYLGEFDAALKEHKGAMASPELRNQAQLEAMIDLTAMRKWSEACQSLNELPDQLLQPPQISILKADLLLHCGKREQGLSLVKQLYSHEHSAAEEGLAHVFGQLNRYSKYKTDIEYNSKIKKNDLKLGQAEAELLMCGDYVNPWMPKTNRKKAAEKYEELHKLSPESCPIVGRFAVLTLWNAEAKTQSKLDREDLEKSHILLNPFLKDGPACVEVAEAQYVYLADINQGEPEAKIQWLETSKKRFPNSRTLNDLLIEEYRLTKRESENRGVLEKSVKDDPDDWFPYVRLALLDLNEKDEYKKSIAWLNQGLEIIPDSTALNYLLSLIYLKSQRYTQAVEPSARFLAGLLETRIYHADWQSGILALQNSIDHKAPFPENPSEKLGLNPKYLMNNHGCFSPSVSKVGITSIAMRPEVVYSSASTLPVK